MKKPLSSSVVHTRDQSDYENFKELLENPCRDALTILRDRSIVPKFIQTYANGSQARFLMNKVNPSTKGDVLTDDVGLRGFMEALISYCVNSDGEVS